VATTEITKGTHTAAEVVAAVRSKEFAFARRGYDQDQVRNFLNEMSRAIEFLDEQRQQAKLDLESAKAEIAHLREAEPSSSGPDPFVDAGSQVAEILRSVNMQAETMRKEAAAAAERARQEAESQAAATLKDAMEELAVGRDMLLVELEGTRDRVSGIIERMQGALSRASEQAPRRAEPQEDPAPWTAETQEDPAAWTAETPDDPPAPDEHGEYEQEPADRPEDDFAAVQDEPVIDEAVDSEEPDEVPDYLKLFSGQQSD